MDTDLVIKLVASLTGVGVPVTWAWIWKARKQCKKDTIVAMDDGLTSARIILRKADPAKSALAEQEYLNNNTSYIEYDFVRPQHAKNLFDLQEQITTILATPSVYIKSEQRERLIQLKHLLRRCENSYTARNNQFALARCYKCIDQMETIKGSV